MRNFMLPLAAAAALAAAAPAHAVDVRFTGFAHGSESVSYTLSSPNTTNSGTVSAGGFATSLNGGPTFETYCVDLYQTIAFGTTYNEYTGPTATHVFANANAANDLGRLYATAGVVNDSLHEAAFQVAVWEIAYEKTGSAYDLGSGAASFGAAANVLSLAQGWLSNLSDGAHPSILTLESTAHQDVIYAPVPEPETYAMMLAGFAAMGFIARRRRRS